MVHSNIRWYLQTKCISWTVVQKFQGPSWVCTKNGKFQSFDKDIWVNRLRIDWRYGLVHQPEISQHFTFRHFRGLKKQNNLRLWKIERVGWKALNIFALNIFLVNALLPYTRLPSWLLLTLSLYLVPFLRYSTSKFSGFDLDFWLSEVTWGQKYFIIRKPMHDFLSNFY